MKYEMKTEYLIGVEKMDEQHAKLLELMEDAHDLWTDENKLYKCADIRVIIRGIQDYVRLHFTDEEDYMKELQYAGLAEHKKLHAAFAKKMEEFYDHVSELSLDTQDGMIVELLEYLQNWLLQHICEEDKKYVAAK